MTYSSGHNKVEILYKEYKNMVYGIILKYQVDDNDVEDLAQDVMVRIINNCDKFQDPLSVKTKNYICAMTKNRVMDYFNEGKRKFDNVMYIEDMIAEVESKKTIEQEILFKLTNEQRRECIHNLRAEYKIAFHLRYVKEYSEQEIGEMLGITVENVRVRLHRATKQLRKLKAEIEEKGGIASNEKE